MMLPYYSSLRDQARQMRKEPTHAERILWRELRGRKFLGYKFVRQKPIIEFIADFYCHELSLVIEIDGSIHDNQQDYDHARTYALESFGLTIIRYTNDQVIYSLPRVLNHLKKVVTQLASSQTQKKHST
jgi:very-short-patch-repair endonuclease